MAVKKTATPTAKSLSHEEIEARARQIYEERIRKNLSGDAVSDWLKAEKELKKSKA